MMGQTLRGNTINQASAEKIASAGLDGKELLTIDASTTSLAASAIRSYHRTISSILVKAVKWKCAPDRMGRATGRI